MLKRRCLGRKISLFCPFFLWFFFSKKKQKDVFRTNRMRFFSDRHPIAHPTPHHPPGGRHATEHHRRETPSRERETMMHRRRATETVFVEEEDRRRAESKAETPFPFYPLSLFYTRIDSKKREAKSRFFFWKLGDQKSQKNISWSKGVEKTLDLPLLCIEFFRKFSHSGRL